MDNGIVNVGVQVNNDLGYNANFEDDFTVELEYAGLYTITGDFGKLNGSVSIMQGRKSVATGTVKNGVLKFNNGKNVLLDSANKYTIVVKNTDKGKSASEYSFTLEGKTLYTKGDSTDDWTDMKTAGAAGAVGSVGAIAAPGTVIGSEWVGYGDAVDYKAFTLDSAAKLSFTVSASDAAKFTINQLVTNKNGTYTLKALQTSTPVLNKNTGKYEVTTKGLLLEAGTYYLGVQSTNAARGGDADYSVTLDDQSVFYTKGDSTDDWTDMKTAGAAGAVGALGVSVDGSATDLLSGWVGYGDAVDYKAFTLDSAAKLSFDVTATDAAKVTINQLVTNKNGTYTLKALQTSTPVLNKNTGKYEITTKGLLLEAGTYYLGVQSTNAARGGDADYSVTLDDQSVFYTDGDTGANNWLYDAKTKQLNESLTASGATKIDGDTGVVAFDGGVGDTGDWDGFVGYGDDTDFARITLAEAGSLSFDLEASDAAKFTVSQLVRNANGTYTLKALQTTTLAKSNSKTEKNYSAAAKSVVLAKAKGEANYSAATKSLKLEAGEYYLSMQSTNAAKGGTAYYNVSLNQSRTDFYENLFVGYDAALTVEQQPGGTDVVLNWEASPADDKRKVTYFVSIDGGKAASVSKTTYTFKNLSMTDHVVSVYAKDEYGNVSETFDSKFHIADNVAPKISGLTIKTNEKTAIFFIKATDNVGIAYYHVTYDGGEPQHFYADDYDPVNGYVRNGLEYGEHTVTVQAEDAAGNLSAVFTKDFTLNPPKGAIALDTSNADELVDEWGGNYGQQSFVFERKIAAGDSRLYKFTADKAAKFRISELTEDPSATVTLYREVSDDLVVKELSLPVIDDHFSTYLEKGVYYMYYKAGKENSDWRIKLSLANPDNNTFKTATDMNDGGLRYDGKYGNGNFYLGASDPVDYYKFTIANGEEGIYRFGAYDADRGAKQTLYDADGNQLDSRKVTAYDLDVLPTKYFAAGDYYLKLERLGNYSEDYNLGLLKA